MRAHGLVVVCLPTFEPTTLTVYPPVMGTHVPGLGMSIDTAAQRNGNFYPSSLLGLTMSPTPSHLKDSLTRFKYGFLCSMDRKNLFNIPAEGF